MGSKSDLPVMQDAIDILKGFDIDVEVDIVSAHRTPDKLFDYGKNAHTRGIKVIIAGAGGAAHLPGMVASHTTLPVVGVPVKSSSSAVPRQANPRTSAIAALPRRATSFASM